MFIKVLLIAVKSSRLCALKLCLKSTNLLVTYAYQLCKDGEYITDKLIHVHSLVEHLIDNNSDSHNALRGDSSVGNIPRCFLVFVIILVSCQLFVMAHARLIILTV
jgi:hypothetical protein